MDVKVIGGQREDYKDTADRLEKVANVLFSQFRCSAYIGRGWQYLVIYLNMPMRQQSSLLLFSLLNICGDRLVVQYRQNLKKLLEIIKNKWLPEYEKYMGDDANKGKMFEELQNEPSFLDGPPTVSNTGIKDARTTNNKLKEKCDKLIQWCDDRQF